MNNNNLLQVAKCLYGYDASSAEELAFSESDLVLLFPYQDLSPSNTADWVTGHLLFSTANFQILLDHWPLDNDDFTRSPDSKLSDRLIPRNYIEQVDAVEYVVDYDYDRHAEGELCVKEGDHVQVYHSTDDGWSIVSHFNQSSAKFEIGFLPTNYLSLVSTVSNSLGATTGQGFSQKELSLAHSLNESVSDDQDYVDPLKAYAMGSFQSIDIEEFDDEFDNDAGILQMRPTSTLSSATADPSAASYSTSAVTVADSKRQTEKQKHDDTIDVSTLSKTYSVAGLWKVGKKTRSKEGYLSYSATNSQILFFEDLSKKERSSNTKRILYQFPLSTLAKTTREKKYLVLDFGSFEFKFLFKSKNEIFEFLECFGGTIADENRSQVGSSGSLEAKSEQMDRTKQLQSNKKSDSRLASSATPTAVPYLPPRVIPASPIRTSPSPKPTTFGRILFDYSAQGDDEVDVYANESCEIYDMPVESGWIKVAIHRNNKVFTGLIPQSYIEAINDKNRQMQTESSNSPDISLPPAKPERRVISPSSNGLPPVKPPRPSASMSPTNASGSISSSAVKQSGTISPSQVTSTATNNFKPFLPPRRDINPTQEPTETISLSKNAEKPPHLISRPIIDSVGRSATKRAENTSERPSISTKSSLDRPSTADLKSPKSPSSPGKSSVKRELRTWTDKSGTFKVEASFVALTDGKIVLLKTNGVKIGVNKEKISNVDLEYISKVIGVDVGPIPISPVETAPLSPKPPVEILQPSIIKQQSKEVSESDFDWKSFFVEAGVPESDSKVYADKFVAEKMGSDTLSYLSREVLKDLGVAQGHAIRVMAHSRKLLTSSNTSIAPATESIARPSTQIGSPKVTRAENDIMRPLEPKKNTDVTSGSISSLFSDPEVKAKLLAAEQEAQKKTMTILAAKKPSISGPPPSTGLFTDLESFESTSRNPTTTSSNSFFDLESNSEKQEQLRKDEELARKLQDMELRNAGLSTTTSTFRKESNAVTAKSQNNPVGPVETKKDESPNLDWVSSSATRKPASSVSSAAAPSSFSVNPVLSGPENSTTSVRRGRVSAANNIDAEKIFSAAKSLSTTSTATVPVTIAASNNQISTPSILTGQASQNQQLTPSLAFTAQQQLPLRPAPMQINTPLAPQQVSMIDPSKIRIDTGDTPVQISVKPSQTIDAFKQTSGNTLTDILAPQQSIQQPSSRISNMNSNTMPNQQQQMYPSMSASGQAPFNSTMPTTSMQVRPMQTVGAPNQPNLNTSIQNPNFNQMSNNFNLAATSGMVPGSNGFPIQPNTPQTMQNTIQPMPSSQMPNQNMIMNNANIMRPGLQQQLPAQYIQQQQVQPQIQPQTSFQAPQNNPYSNSSHLPQYSMNQMGLLGNNGAPPNPMPAQQGFQNMNMHIMPSMQPTQQSTQTMQQNSSGMFGGMSMMPQSFGGPPMIQQQPQAMLNGMSQMGIQQPYSGFNGQMGLSQQQQPQDKYSVFRDLQQPNQTGFNVQPNNTMNMSGTNTRWPT